MYRRKIVVFSIGNQHFKTCGSGKPGSRQRKFQHRYPTGFLNRSGCQNIDRVRLMTMTGSGVPLLS